MLGFFLDSGLTRPITQGSPKRFLASTYGTTKTSTVYLGDPYSAALTAAATTGAAVLHLDKVDEFLTAGQAKIGAMTITYTGISGLTLTGVSGVSTNVSLGAIIVPYKQWACRSQVTAQAQGPDTSILQVSLGQSGSYAFPGMPFIMSSGTAPILLGVAVAVQIKVMAPAGVPFEFVNWSAVTSAFFPQTGGSSSSIPSNAIGIVPTMYGYLNRRDEGLPQWMRLLPVNRDVSAPPPGFVFGRYAWRDSTEVNAQVIIPSNWKTDPNTLGNEKFIAGIGQADDLKPLGFEQENESIYLKIERGFYFTGPKGYYLPAAPQLDVIGALDFTLPLSQKPQPTFPIFVGTYARDSQGFYESSIVYRYKTAAAVTAGKDLPEYYFTYHPSSNSITLNKTLPVLNAYLGTITGETTDYFDLPIYPIDHVESIFVLRSDGSQLIAVNWQVDLDKGRVTITNPAGSGASIAGSLAGEIVMINCTPAVAVLYETSPNSSRLLDTVDLNPAFAGISGGYVYLQHSRQEVAKLVLACDKPIIDIPATLTSIIGLVAYGPVFFDGDYALLQVTAFSDVPGQTIQGAELEVIVDSATFTGSLNYVDPLSIPITVKTGADGIANLIYRPSKNYGFYIPHASASGSLAGLATTTITNDTLVLPQAVPISQLYSAGDDDPWLVTTYSVANNNPVLGMVGADPAQGEVTFATSGTPGTTDYKTNGERRAFLALNNILRPVQMLDTTGTNYLDSGFNGNVIKLVYGQALPTLSTVGAYFVTFLQRTLIKVKAVDSNVVSNSIMIQMAAPALIDDDVWLILNDSVHGILNQYRLGWTITSTT